MMKTLRTGFLRVICSSVLALLLSSAQAQVVNVTSLSPGSGAVGSTVTIVGTGFNTTAANNVVFFGATQATIQSATGTSPITLTVTVPSGADYRYISVTNLTTGLTGYAARPFVVTYSPTGEDTFRAKVSLTSGSSASTCFVTLADMNNDGKPDLLVANSNNTLSVFPNQTTSSTATASFGSAVTLGTASGSVSSCLAVGDLDGDGFLDIAAVFSGAASVSAYRNTTGTPGNTPSFAAAVATTTASTPVGVSMADVDLNGKPDIIVVSSLASSNVSVISGLGLSLGVLAFLPAQTFSAGTNPSSVALGDLNQDGKLDVVVANHGSNNVTVFHNTTVVAGTLGLAATATLNAGTSPTSVDIADLDGDTWLDIVVANSGNGHISAFRSTSSANTISFASSTDLSTGGSSGPIAVAAGDTDGDGKPDLMTANYSNNTVALLHNTSSGGTLSFTTSTDVSNSNVTSPSSIAVDDINADSKPDFVVAVSGTSNNVGVFLQKISQSLTVTSASALLVDASLSVTVSRSVSPTTLGGSLGYSVAAGSGSATVDSSGNLTAISAGTITLTVTGQGDTDYASASTTQLITISKATPTLSITSASVTVVDGILTVTVSTTASHDIGELNYGIENGTGSAIVDSFGLLTAIAAGDITLTVTSAGNADYNAGSVSQYIIIGQATPTLTFTSPDSMNVDDTFTASVVTTATFSRGGSITFSIAVGSGSATVDTDTGLITATGAGTVTLLVTSSGDADYYPSSTSQLITINKTTPTLLITSADSLNVDGSLTVTTTTTADVSSGGALSYQVVAGSGSATVDGNGLLIATGTGTVTLTVTSSGDTNYNGTSASQLITISKTTPMLTVTSVNSLNVDGSLTVATTTTAGVSSGGALSYQITAGSGSATVDGNGLLTATGSGTVTLIVSSSGDTNYNGTSASQLITISRSTPTLTITSANSLNVDGSLTATVITTATGGRGGSYSYSIVGGSGSATVNATTGYVMAINAGTVTLQVNSAGDADYNAASTSQAITISKTTPTLSITSANSLNVGGSLTATVVTTATGGRGGAITFQIRAGSGSATVNVTTGYVVALGAGTVTLTALSAGDSDYIANTQDQLITINKVTPTLTITSANSLNVDGSLIVTTMTTADGGGALSYQVVGGSGSATVDGNGLLIATGAGTVTLTVSSSGDTNYYGTSTSQLITVGMTTPTLVITSSATTIVDATLTVTTSTTASHNTGTLSYNIDNGTGSAIVDGDGIITAIGAGQVTLTVTSAGNADYNSTNAVQLITIGRATPTLTITSANTMDVDDVSTVDVVTAATFGRGGSITFSITAGSGSATIDTNTGAITAISVGTVTVTAMSAGDEDYSPSSTSQLITIGKATPTLTITSANSLVVDSSLTATTTTSATGGRGGVITYSIVSGTGVATVNSSTGFVTAISAGAVTLTANQAGDANYYGTSVDQAIIIGQATPVITIDSENTLSVDDIIVADAFSSATFNRGGPLAFIIVAGSGSATIDPDSSELTGISVGTITLTAFSTGDSDYYPASTGQLVTITKATPTLTITSNDQVNVDGTLAATTTTSATRGRGGNITYSITTTSGAGSATVDPNSGLITGVSIGTVTLTATNAGDTNYYSISTTQVVTVNKSTPTLTITSANSLNVDASLTATVVTTATLGRGGNLTYSIVAGSGSATVNASTGLITGVSIGTVTLTAISAGDTNYYGASISQLITISKVTPTLTITSAGSVNVDGTLTATTITSATLGQGGVITYSIAAGSGSATVNTNTGLIFGVGAGTVTLTSTSAGDTNYYSASTTQVVTINKITPTLTITSGNSLLVDSTLTATTTTSATGGRGGNITYSVAAGSGSATVNASTGLVTGVSVGTVTLTATSSGDANYYPASMTQVITINQTGQTLTITSASSLLVDGTLTATTITTATGGRGGSITYSIIAGSGSATVNSSTGLITGVSIGTVTLTASTVGDANYSGASATQVITINMTTPTLTITSSSKTIVDASLTVTVTTSATLGRGGVITFSITAGSGSATIDSSTGLLHAINAGTVTVTVSSAGDTNYFSAIANQLITIGKATPTLTITSSNTMVVDQVMFASVSSSVANPGTITFSNTNGTGIIVVVSSTEKVTAVQVGSATLKATSAGTSNYYPVTVSQAMTIKKTTPTLTITAPSGNTMMVGSSLTVTFTTSATFNRGGAKSYAVAAGTGSATINSSTGYITAVSTGTVTLTVSTAGDANYYPESTSKLMTITASMLSVRPIDEDAVLKVVESNIATEDNSLAERAVTIPMMLSPNGDGVDDVLIINHLEDYPENELVIANRNGEMVFKTHGYNNSSAVFSGVSNTGAPLADGVYYYTLVFYDQGRLNRRVGYFKLKRE